ncbi:MAG TPA: aspartyl protease family protein [Pirellulales bacterium]|nr:aspartyl protease family protein [Pirellulales bacterium]
MEIRGEWYVCNDGVVRPILRGEVLAANGRWRGVEFLVDTGADRTVFTASLFAVLGLEPTQADVELNGFGGTALAGVVRTRIRLTDTLGRKIDFRGEFAAAGDAAILDIAVLGRDVTNLFALITDRQGDLICLLRGNDRYQIVRGSS